MIKKTVLIVYLFLSVFLYAEPSFKGYGIAEVKNQKELINKPTKISIMSRLDKLSGSAEFSSDFYMISRRPLPELERLLMDLNGAASIFKRIAYSKDLTPGNMPAKPHIQEIHTAYKFIGIGSDYSYRVKVFFDTVSNNEFAMRWELCDSMNNGIEELMGFWYLKKITTDDGDFTYVRNYAHSVVSDLSAVAVFFARSFGDSEAKQTLTNLISYKR